MHTSHDLRSLPSTMYGDLDSDEGILIMAMNRDFSRSSLIAEQYKREMELISLSLQEESQDEREERLGLVARSWALTRACFCVQLESSDASAFVPSVAFARR